MAIRVRSTDLHVLNTRTRMPFRYGIAALTAVPHLFVRIEVEVAGRRAFGIASEGLAPKWFTKDPNTTFEQDLNDMFRVIRSACEIVRSVGEAETLFDFWQAVYRGQERWAQSTTYPPLLWAFGVTLVERALIDGFCRATDRPFASAVRMNTLGIRLEDIHEELQGFEPNDILPQEPLRSIIVRHTVGLSDPLTDDDIPEAERLDDGLPQSLEACIEAYGLTHFKIKLAGNPDRDRERLRRIASAIDAAQHDRYAYTLDGNENYGEVAAFREFWHALVADEALRPFVSGLLFVEQPLHRSVALSAAVCQAKLTWEGRPPLIVDESDDALDTVRRALGCGYVGTSHKNCKGVFKGIANACLIRLRTTKNPGERYVMSGEDLANIGPIALIEDLSALATLGIGHAERNGHHYFRGLSMYPEDVQGQVVTELGDLYRHHPRGYATLSIKSGKIDIGTVVDAPFGPAFPFDPTRYTPFDEWDYRSLGA